MTCAFPAATVVALTLSVVPAAPTREPDWQPPLHGPLEVVRPFRPPPGPYAPGHRGVDLAAEPGDPVLAAGRGRVSFAGRVAGRGVVVVVHPGGVRTTYEPVGAGVGVGTTVARGAVLGALETSRHCPAPCLHWGLREAGGYRDPMTLLDPPGRGRVRLLPLEAPAGSVSASRPSASCAGRASPSNGSGRSGSPRRRRAPRPRRG